MNFYIRLSTESTSLVKPDSYYSVGIEALYLTRHNRILNILYPDMDKIVLERTTKLHSLECVATHVRLLSAHDCVGICSENTPYSLSALWGFTIIGIFNLSRHA